MDESIARLVVGETMTQAENVAFVRALMEGSGGGFADDNTLVSGETSMLEAHDPDIVYYGLDSHGQISEHRGRDALFAMIHGCIEAISEVNNTFLNIFAAGDEMVVVHARGFRRAKSTNETIERDWVMVVRIENGKITRGVDLTDRALQDFYVRSAASA